VSSIPIPSTQVRNDVETIVETHALSGSERERLTRIVTGAIVGNRDRPLYGLAGLIRDAVAESGGRIGLFDLLAPVPRNGSRPRLLRFPLAMLDFLATMDSYRYFGDIEVAVLSLIGSDVQEGLSSAAGTFASCLHHYRVDHLPFENRRQAFSSIRTYFTKARPGSGLPEDGDAISFWSEMATPEGWTTYSAALGVLVDFAEAAAVRGAESEASFEALTEKGYDTEIGLFSLSSDGDPSLGEAVNALSAGSLKIFKGPELEELRRLAAALPALYRWRRAGLARLCFGPVQNVLVENRRQGADPDRQADTATCDGARSYAEELAVLEEIGLGCRDMAILYQKLGADDHETTPRPSISDVEAEKRIAGMMRRRSFAELDRDSLRDGLRDALPALAAVVAELDRILGRLRAWPAAARDATFQIDRAKFADTFRRLYCLKGN